MERAAAIGPRFRGPTVNFTLQFGPQLTEGGVIFRLWAPAAHRVMLVLDRKLAMTRTGDWFALEIPRASAGVRYGFEIDGDIEFRILLHISNPTTCTGPAKLSITLTTGAAGSGPAGPGTK